MRLGNLERNAYVCKQLEDAMLALLKEKELKDISINELVDKACVSRVSFYRNYTDKEDLIKTALGRKILTWYKQNQEKFDKAKAESGSDNAMLSALFTFLKKDKELFLLLQERGLFYLFRDCFLELYGPKKDYPNGSAYISAFFFYGIYGWIEEWVRRGMQESGKEMMEMLAKTVRK